MRTVEEIRTDIDWAERHYRFCELERYNNELRAALTADIPLDRLEALCNAEREERYVVIPEWPICISGDEQGRYRICGADWMSKTITFKDTRIAAQAALEGKG